MEQVWAAPGLDVVTAEQKLFAAADRSSSGNQHSGGPQTVAAVSQGTVAESECRLKEEQQNNTFSFGKDGERRVYLFIFFFKCGFVKFTLKSHMLQKTMTIM